MQITFSTKRALREYVRRANDTCTTPMEFEEWLNNNADKLYVANDEEPYSASELAELI